MSPVTYTEAELIEFYNERVAIRFYDSIASNRYEWLSENGKLMHERWAQKIAYVDWRKMVGDDVAVPEAIRNSAGV